MLWSVQISFTFIDKRKPNEYYSREVNLVFLHVDIAFDMPKNLVTFLPIFVKDTKIIGGNNFVAFFK